MNINGVIKMQKIIKYSFIGLIFLGLFIFKDYLYGFISIFNNESKYEEVLVSNQVQSDKNVYLTEELEKLNEATNFDIETDYNYLLTKVSFRNPYTFYETLIIPKGSNDNIKENMAVVGKNGIIGIISEVNKNSSKVELITNSNNEISVIIHGSYGITAGYSNEKEYLIVKNMNNYDNIEVGDLVYTSGLGNLPKGILIGRVEKIEYDKYEIEQKIYVNNKNNLDDIKIVAVLLKLKEE